MACCSVPGCPSGNAGNKAALYPFPDNIMLRKTWLDTIRRTHCQFVIGPKARICEEHFDRACFANAPRHDPETKRKTKRKRLESGACPTVFRCSATAETNSAARKITLIVGRGATRVDFAADVGKEKTLHKNTRKARKLDIPTRIQGVASRTVDILKSESNDLKQDLLKEVAKSEGVNHNDNFDIKKSAMESEVICKEGNGNSGSIYIEESDAHNMNEKDGNSGRINIEGSDANDVNEENGNNCRIYIEGRNAQFDIKKSAIESGIIRNEKEGKCGSIYTDANDVNEEEGNSGCIYIEENDTNDVNEEGGNSGSIENDGNDLINPLEKSEECEQTCKKLIESAISPQKRNFPDTIFQFDQRYSSSLNGAMSKQCEVPKCENRGRKLNANYREKMITASNREGAKYYPRLCYYHFKTTADVKDSLDKPKPALGTQIKGRLEMATTFPNKYDEETLHKPWLGTTSQQVVKVHDQEEVPLLMDKRRKWIIDENEEIQVEKDQFTSYSLVKESLGEVRDRTKIILTLYSGKNFPEPSYDNGLLRVEAILNAEKVSASQPLVWCQHPKFNIKLVWDIDEQCLSTVIAKKEKISVTFFGSTSEHASKSRIAEHKISMNDIRSQNGQAFWQFLSSNEVRRRSSLEFSLIAITQN